MSSPGNLQPLQTKLTAITALLSHLRSTLSRESNLPTPTTTGSTTIPNPLHVLRDSSTLLKAQTTKLSLLLITSPFTPSAVITVLTACESECLPAMFAGWEIMRSEQGTVWPSIVCEEVRRAVSDVVSGFGEVVREVRDKVEREGRKEEDGKGKERVLATTGVAWKTCEKLGELCALGIVGILCRKVEAWRETVRDALEELKEWGDDGGEDEDDEAVDSDGVDADGVEVMFEAANKLPRGRTDLQERLEESLRRVRLVGTLFQALGKRRVKTISEFDGKGATNEPIEKRKEIARKMDELVALLCTIPDLVDELASAFYDLDVDEVDKLLEQISDRAKRAATEVKLSWDAKEDEFTAWTTKWEDAMKSKAMFINKVG